MSTCPAHGGDYRKGVTVTLLDPVTGPRRARVCQSCANGGLIIVAPKIAPVVQEKVARPEGYDGIVRQLAMYAKMARTTADSAEDGSVEQVHQEARAEGIECAIETLKQGTK
jgi:hypothetical protein